MFIAERAGKRLAGVQITVSNAAVYIYAKFPIGKKGCLCLGKYMLLRIMCAILQNVFKYLTRCFCYSLSLCGDSIVCVIELMTVQLV